MSRFSSTFDEEDELLDPVELEPPDEEAELEAEDEEPPETEDDEPELGFEELLDADEEEPVLPLGLLEDALFLLEEDEAPLPVSTLIGWSTSAISFVSTISTP